MNNKQMGHFVYVYVIRCMIDDYNEKKKREQNTKRKQMRKKKLTVN